MREPGSRTDGTEQAWDLSHEEYLPAIMEVAPPRDARTGVPARFIGGPLDGRSLVGVCARRYMVPVRERPLIRSAATFFVPLKIKTVVYGRSAARYVDGDTRATDDNLGQLSHLEYTYLGTEERTVGEYE